MPHYTSTAAIKGRTSNERRLNQLVVKDKFLKDEVSHISALPRVCAQCVHRTPLSIVVERPSGLGDAMPTSHH